MVALAVGAVKATGAEGPPEVVGSWSAPFSWPIVAVHMSLEPTGEVLAFDGFADAPNSERLWNPTTGAFTAVPYGRNLFCAGHTQLPDGRTLIVGGHISANNGLADTTIFNSQTRTWTRGPDMAVGRWYPTATQLPNGHVFVLGGDNIVQDRPGADPPFSDASVDSLPEVYNPTTNSWTALQGSRLTSPLYPYLFVLSDGRLVNVGPDKVTRTIAPGAWAWQTVATSGFDGGSAVMYRPDKIMKSGSWADPDFRGSAAFTTTNRTAVLDMTAATPAWRETAPMSHGRAYHTLTMLPDGTVLASGGGAQSDGIDLGHAVLPAEIWNPDTETWTEVDGLQNGRLYHSTAILLADGRVLMAGGGRLPNSGATDQLNGEIYSPSYLFKGPRPAIATAPSNFSYNSTISVTSPDAASVASVSLIKTPSVTHAFDQSQRFMRLPFTRSGDTLTIDTPRRASDAPPGDYLLFLVNGNGVPSVGSFLRVATSTDATAPTTAVTAPTAGAVSGTVDVTASASDNDVVAGVQFTLDGNPLGLEDRTAPYSVPWDTTTASGGSHTLRAIARDPSGNTTTSAPVVVTAGSGAPPAGLVGEWGFDEGSGTTTADSTGKGHTATISGATWAAGGRYGSALSFDGTNDLVTVADANDLDLTTGMTLEAWVRPSALGTAWRTVGFKEASGTIAYGLYANRNTQVPAAEVVIGGAFRNADGTTQLPLNAWTHLAATYDGASLRIYVGGTLVSTTAASGSLNATTGALRFGGNNVWGEWFAGLIDEVRVYNRALDANEIASDMARAVGVPDTTSPGAPASLTATGGLGQVALSWPAATDDRGVAGYDVHRGTAAGFTPSAANRIAQPTTTSYTDTGLTPGTYHYRVVARDAAGNAGPPSPEASGTASADTTPPSAPGTLTATGGAGAVTLTWGAATDNGSVARYNVHRGTSPGFAPTTSNRVAQPTGTSHVDGGLAAGTYYYRVTAEDAAANVGPPSNEATGTVSDAAAVGLVGAWGFDEGSGTTAADATGRGHSGTISGATWAAGGRYGGALSFDGTNDWVTVADANDLDLTTGMTLEAWVRPTALGTAWRSVGFKEATGTISYGLYANRNTQVPTAEVVIGGAFQDADGAAALPLNAWTHLATTYDGSTLRLYVNGALVGTQAASGSLAATTGALRFGGNSIWGEYFSGLLDEIRVYSRALSAAEITDDMSRAVGVPDTSAPTQPGAFAVTNATETSISVSWTASTDDRGVAEYRLFRGATQVGTTPGTTFAFTGLTCGTPNDLRVAAADAAGNVSTQATLNASTAACDTSPPTAPTNFVRTAATATTISTSWTASTDDRGVTQYRLYRGTTQVGTATGTTFTFTGMTCSTSADLGIEAADAAGNVSARTTLTTSTSDCDTTSPTVSVTQPAAGTVTGTVSVAASASDNDQVAGVQFRLDGVNLGTEDTTSPYSVTWDTRTASNGPHQLTAVARDPSANTATSAVVAVTVSNTVVPNGLVGAWGFDESSGTTTADATGKGHTGTISGATWSASGRYGGALSFDGTNDFVSVADANDLDLTTGMTVMAWVRPTTTSGWRTVVMKEQTSNMTYALYGSRSGNGSPVAEAFVGTPFTTQGTGAVGLNAWSHLAATYDGTALRLYVNGALVGTSTRSGTLATSTGPLKFGGNAIWSEWFSGLLDEIRVYNRALTSSEIQSDMNLAVGIPDTSPPTAPTSVAATGGVGQVQLSWTAATDDRGVTRYNVHRSTTSGFVPSATNRVGQPTATSFVDGGLAAGTYYYRVTAEDATGNVGPASSEASGTATADTTPPTVSITAPPAGATVSNTVTVTANAADNQAVAGVQFRVDGTNVGGEDTTAPYSFDWNTRTTTNAAHSLTAVARDSSGLTTTSAAVSVTVDNAAAPPPGLVAGYGFDEVSGTSVFDVSGNNHTGTVSGATRAAIGKFAGALGFDGVNDWVTIADTASLRLSSGMTLSAWVRPTALGNVWRTVVFKEQTGNLVYGLYASTNSGVPSGNVFTGGTDHEVRGTALPLGAWSHLATTYDGSALRVYVNGTLAGTQTVGGSIASSTGALRIGGNNIWPEWFQGLIDEVRVYNRALPQGEIQADMAVGVARDTSAPTVTARTPAAGASGVGVGTRPTATFSEPMNAATLTPSTFDLRDGGGAIVAATVAYDEDTGRATLTPTAGALVYGTTYTVRVRSGAAGAKDKAGNALAADETWTFTTEPPPPPVLVLGSTSNPFSTYAAEILRAEGLNLFTILDVSLVNPLLLTFYDAIVLGDISLTPTQVTMLSDWVQSGGNLIALSPDKQLAGLLGLTDAGSTLADAYLRVDTASEPGAGIVAETIQYHGTADRYTLNGARAVATLYSTASTATANPAVTLRSVGTNGGQAAAFTFDLARSTVYTRQGNPAWVGQNRDGIVPIRTNDLFYGGAQPNFVDLAKLAIPQADELQRLFANLLIATTRDRKPLPRFWYLPRGEKAAIVMTGDDHAVGGTAGRFDQYKALSPGGCSVIDWECVRGTSYIYPTSPLTNAQAAAYLADGFEVALHPQTGTPCADWTPSLLRSFYTSQLGQFTAKYTSVPVPSTNRTHCVAWSDWSTMAEVELENGVRLDTNYYHFPPAWASAGAGFMTGSGIPMRFAKLDGTVIDVYQAHTHMNDEASQPYPQTVDDLLNRALGPQGYYGIFTANMHTDEVASAGSDAIVSSALARGVPIVTARQLLTWIDGREASSFRTFSWSGGTLGFTLSVGAGARGLQALLPTTSAAGTLSSLTRGGTPVPYATQTIKGVSYAVFDAAAGTYAATYG